MWIEKLTARMKVEIQRRLNHSFKITHFLRFRRLCVCVSVTSASTSDGVIGWLFRITNNNCQKTCVEGWVDYRSLDGGSSTKSQNVISSAGDAMSSAITLPLCLDLDSRMVLLISKMLTDLGCNRPHTNSISNVIRLINANTIKLSMVIFQVHVGQIVFLVACGWYWYPYW